MEHEIVLETKLVGEIQGEFLIPAYQRGYRWGKDEVTRLLDDVYQNGKKNYCLQPVVVRKKGAVYELVDGQQRLTTLYLIYRYMKNVNPFFGEPAFTLTYETRPHSAEFLRCIALDKRDENIDFCFIANAYQAIQTWFEQDLQIRAMHIFEYFREDVKIIWYEVGENEDAVSLFARLNIGKIPLTSAELVKAMFLSRDGAVRMDREKQEEIALQWDNMEKELHNDSLWYFLTNHGKEQYPTRIDLILDLIAGKEESVREKYDTFFQFDRLRRETSLDNVWKKIQRTFLILKDWYENHALYHKIGYLIASDTLTLRQIFTLSEHRTKTEFNAALDDRIRRSVSITGSYGELSYENPLDYKKISTLLLLFNVMSVSQNGEHTQWFPFDKFKYGKGGKTSWSLEHIHAQQSEGMRTQEAWKEWLRLHLPSVTAVDGAESGLVRDMETAIRSAELTRAGFDALQQRVVALLSVPGSTEYLHSIANLALLNTSDNAALNNSTFDVKRNTIIELDKRGQYIPFCTKMVFLKYYTPSAEHQLHFWGRADRIAYIRAINAVLADYLPEPIILGEDVQ